MRSLRVIDTGEATAEWNTRVSFALLQSFECDKLADILRFYRFRPSVLLGRSQTACPNLDLDYCGRRDIEIARRITGGGAVYMSPAMLAWDFVTDATSGHARLSEKMGRAIASSLLSLDINAEFRPPNDLAVAGKKLSGAATMSFGRSFLHQGTLLIQDDAPEMSAALRIPLSDLRRHVASLSDCLDRPPSLNSVSVAITESLSKTFDLIPVISSLTEHEFGLAKRGLTDEIGLDPPLTRDVSEQGA